MERTGEKSTKRRIASGSSGQNLTFWGLNRVCQVMTGDLAF